MHLFKQNAVTDIAVEDREEKAERDHFTTRHLYRKTAMFDRFLSFDVRLEGADTPRH